MTDASGRVSLRGTEPPPQSPRAVLLGPANGNDLLTVSVYLRPRTGDVPTYDYASDSPPLSREEFAERFSASPEEVKHVQQFAAAEGLDVEEVNLPARRVQLSGTVAQLERAFGVRMMQYQEGSRRYVSHQGPVSIPVALVGAIEVVLGLDTRPLARAGAS